MRNLRATRRKISQQKTDAQRLCLRSYKRENTLSCQSSFRTQTYASQPTENILATLNSLRAKGRGHVEWHFLNFGIVEVCLNWFELPSDADGKTDTSRNSVSCQRATNNFTNRLKWRHSKCFLKSRQVRNSNFTICLWQIWAEQLIIHHQVQCVFCWALADIT